MKLVVINKLRRTKSTKDFSLPNFLCVIILWEACVKQSEVEECPTLFFLSLLLKTNKCFCKHVISFMKIICSISWCWWQSDVCYWMNRCPRVIMYTIFINVFWTSLPYLRRNNIFITLLCCMIFIWKCMTRCSDGWMNIKVRWHFATIWNWKEAEKLDLH